jgi:hypothetical protein
MTRHVLVELRIRGSTSCLLLDSQDHHRHDRSIHQEWNLHLGSDHHNPRVWNLLLGSLELQGPIAAAKKTTGEDTKMMGGRIIRNEISRRISSMESLGTAVGKSRKTIGTKMMIVHGVQSSNKELSKEEKSAIGPDLNHLDIKRTKRTKVGLPITRVKSKSMAGGRNGKDRKNRRSGPGLDGRRTDTSER